MKAGTWLLQHRDILSGNCGGIVVTCKQKIVGELPAIRLSGLTLSGRGVSVSGDVIEHLCRAREWLRITRIACTMIYTRLGIGTNINHSMVAINGVCLECL